MKAICFVPMHNTQGKKDATGAFQPEAARFCKVHGLENSVVLVDNQDEPLERRLKVYDTLEAAFPHSIDTIAFFCHGYKRGLQFGIDRSNIKGLALRMKRVLTGIAQVPRVVLYACDAARDMDAEQNDDTNDHVGGDGGFADLLRDELVDIGCPTIIYAHSTAGHTTQNPHLRVFPPHERFGGKFVVAKDSGLWQKWVRCMRNNDLRFRVPFMTSAELVAELENAP